MLRRLAAEPEFGRFFQLAAAEGARVVDADGAALIQCIDDKRLEYRFFQGLPLRYEQLAVGFSFPDHQGTAGRALHEGVPIFTPDYAGSPQAMPAFVATGLQGNLVVPVGPRDDRRGVLAIAWFTKTPPLAPRPEALDIVLLIADLIYGAMYRQSLEHDLEQQARHDPLTGLPNRRHLYANLQRILAQTQGSPDGVAVAIIDLDGFKPVNDTFGHEAGDQVLQQLAARLKSGLRDGDLVARLGGDEFALILRKVPDRGTLEGLLERLCGALGMHYLIQGGTPVSCPASIGAALYPGHGEGAETLMRSADAAMYRAKRRRQTDTGAWEVHAAFDAEATSLPAPVRLPGRVEVHYQPVFDIQRAGATRFEALARLRRQGKLISPLEFLPGLGPRQRRHLFSAVMEAALEAQREWNCLGGHCVGVSVNIDPESLAEADIAKAIADALGAMQAQPAQLTLEILERGEFLSPDVTRRNLLEISALGVRLAIDDLGSAYSSLLRLRSLPIDEIKMDQTFVREIATRLQDIAFVHSVQNLASSLQVDLVVEGAESADVLNMLHVLGVREVQGYAIARPCPSDEVPELLHQLRAWTLPPHGNPLAAAYARQQMTESHVLGLLQIAPAHLSPALLDDAALDDLETALADVPDARRLHRQQRIILHDLVRHHDLDNRLPILRYRALGARLRRCLIAAMGAA